ncbi:MAG TPA: SDR family oxidoreductase [Acidimicrobiales bacterium]|jgi:3-oxoacyl-[acyl-carrier protein] reductase|nr:SDR family oxidoreductase [Acidimicrobiales bacterium]
MSEQTGGTTRQRIGRTCRWGAESGYATGYSWWGSDPAAFADSSSGMSGRSDEPDLRVSDEERDSVATRLNQHFEAGRLDLTEFEQRTERALRARTRGDLSRLLADLPSLGSANPGRLPRRGPGGWFLLPLVLAIIVAVSVGNVFSDAGHSHSFPWFAIPIGIVVAVRFGRRDGVTGLASPEPNRSAVHSIIPVPNPRRILTMLHPDFIPPSTPGLYPDLAGKLVAITGGSRGIGASTALAFAANGCHLAVVGRDPAALASTVESLKAMDVRAIGVAADCTVEEDVRGLQARVEGELGPVDILAPFAGGNGMPLPTATETGAHWREVIDSDLNSTFVTVSAFLPGMLDRHSGVIITMASAAARQPAKSSAAYAAAKAGVIAFSRHLANEYGHQGIRVNCIAPSAIENDKLRAWVSEEDRQAMGAMFPLGRIGQPEDVAATALFLGSSASSWITGATLDIAGGKVML